MVPKGTPPAIVRYWTDLTRKVVGEPKYLETLKAQNVKSIFEDAEQFARVLDENAALFERLVPTLQKPARK